MQYFLTDAKDRANNAQAKANVADADATYSRQQIDTQGTLVTDFLVLRHITPRHRDWTKESWMPHKKVLMH